MDIFCPTPLPSLLFQSQYASMQPFWLHQDLVQGTLHQIVFQIPAFTVVLLSSNVISTENRNKLEAGSKKVCEKGFMSGYLRHPPDYLFPQDNLLLLQESM